MALAVAKSTLVRKAFKEKRITTDSSRLNLYVQWQRRFTSMQISKKFVPERFAFKNSNLKT